MSAERPEPHPAAEAWPMLPEPDLRRLADDIRENGLRHPIVLDSEGLVLDGRNRIAACKLAGVDPVYETYDGDDPEGYVLSSNNERRHLSLPERAAATALTLGAKRRRNGRWERGSVPDLADDTSGSGSNASWPKRMAEAGMVLDFLGEARLRRVAEGKSALDAEVQAAKKVKAERERISDLPDDLRVLVEADELSVKDAERRAKLSDRYAALVASGDLDLEEAETLNERDEKEHEDALRRITDTIETLVAVWHVVVSMKKSPLRDEVLGRLGDDDREKFLAIEKAVVDAGPTEPLSGASVDELLDVEAEDRCVDCGTPVPADPTFDILRCAPCAVKAGKEDVA